MKYRKPQTERRWTTREILTRAGRETAVDVTSRLDLRLLPTPPAGTRTETWTRARDQTAGQSRKETSWLTTRPKLTLDPQTSPSSSLPQANRSRRRKKKGASGWIKRPPKRLEDSRNRRRLHPRRESLKRLQRRRLAPGGRHRALSSRQLPILGHRLTKAIQDRAKGPRLSRTCPPLARSSSRLSRQARALDARLLTSSSHPRETTGTPEKSRTVEETAGTEGSTFSYERRGSPAETRCRSSAATMTASAGTTAEVALAETTAGEDAEMITTGRVIDLETGKVTEEETDRAAGQMIVIGATIARTGITGEAEEKAEAETITRQVTIDTGATADEVDLRAIDHAAEVL